MRRRPKAAVLDVIGTLFQTEPLDQHLQKIGLPPGSLEVWFPRVLRDGFALETTGTFRSFPEIAAGTLEGLMSEHALEPKKDDIAEVIEAFAELPAYDDVASAL